MKVIVGLGNPGPQYAETRHNIGFLLVDLLAEAHNLRFCTKFQGLWAEGNVQGERILLLKPTTFMNLSGRSVRALTDYYNILGNDLLVVHDDIDLLLGKIRFRSKGGAGGHNGIKSILAELGTDEFWRLKLGIGRPARSADFKIGDTSCEPVTTVIEHVLSPFAADEIMHVEEMLERAEKATYLWIKGETERAMNLYHR